MRSWVGRCCLQRASCSLASAHVSDRWALEIARDNAHSIAIEEEADACDQHHNPLKTLPIDSLADLMSADVAILVDGESAVSLVQELSSWDECRNTCSWSKSRALSVLYSRPTHLPILTF